MTANKPFPDAHETLGSLLRRPYERMYRWLYAELALRGFEEVRPGFSVVLRNLPPVGARVTELAALGGMTKQSMGYLVDQMAAVGLVEITPDANDKRAKTVRLTARGEQVVLVGVQLAESYEARFAQLIGERKMTQLRAILIELYERLEDITDTPPAQ